MATLTQGPRTGEFLLSEAPGQRSRENGVAGATLKAGDVVKVSTSKLVSYDGSGTVVGIVWADCVEDDPVAYIARDAEVKQDYLTSTEQTDGTIDTAGISGLADLGIICRS
jgi:hypothetical protein